LYFFDGAEARCEPCGASVIYAALIAVMSIVLLALVRLVWRQCDATRHWLTLYAARVSFRSRLRVAISFYQV
jgi:hypothetical protein